MPKKITETLNFRVRVTDLDLKKNFKSTLTRWKRFYKDLICLKILKSTGKLSKEPAWGAEKCLKKISA